MKKAEGMGAGAYIIIFLLLVLVMFLVYVMVVKDGGLRGLFGGDNDTDDDGGEDHWYETIIRTSISNAFHSQIDPVFPAYINNAEILCGLLGGDWYDGRNRFGCFETVTPYNATACTGVQALAMQNICNGLEDAIWDCDNRNIGCYYP